MANYQTTETASTLRDSVRLLGDLLGQVIREQVGDDCYELEEELRLAAKARRTGQDAEALSEQLRNHAETFAQQPQQALQVLKAFELYFQLINLAEEQHRVSVLRQRSQQAHTQQQALKDSLEAAIAELHQQGLDANAIQSLLNQIMITPVFTAHPTEAKRRVVQ